MTRILIISLLFFLVACDNAGSGTAASDSAKRNESVRDSTTEEKSSDFRPASEYPLPTNSALQNIFKMDPNERKITNFTIIHNVVGSPAIYIVYEGGDANYTTVQSANAQLAYSILSAPFATFNVKSKKIKAYTQTPPKTDQENKIL